jgi:hypothetical protein
MIEEGGYVKCRSCGLVIERSVESTRSTGKFNNSPPEQHFEWWFMHAHHLIKLKHFHRATLFLNKREMRSSKMYEYFRMFANALGVSGFIFTRALYIANKLLEEFCFFPKVSAATGIWMALNEYRHVDVHDVITRNTSGCTTRDVLLIASSLVETLNWRKTLADMATMQDVVKVKIAKRGRPRIDKKEEEKSGVTIGTCPHCNSIHYFEEYESFIYLTCSVCGRDARIKDYHFSIKMVETLKDARSFLSKEMRLILKRMGLKKYADEQE